MEIFLRDILVKFYSFECNTRGQCTTRARAILNAHIKTRAHESSGALKIPPVMRSIHTTPRETPESFSQSIWYPHV